MVSPSLDVQPDTIRKILVCQLRQIGDVLLATPSITLLNNTFPQAEIHVLTEQKCAPVLEHNPRVTRIWTIDKKRLTSLFKEVCFYREVASQGFDLVVDFQQLPRCRWVVAFSRAKIRLSFTPPWYNRWLYTGWVSPLDGYAAMSKASILRPLHISWQGEMPELYLTGEEKQHSLERIKEWGVEQTKHLVTVDPTHRRETRRWPASKFADLIRLALQKEPSLRFLVLYGPGEEDIARKVAAEAGSPDHCFLPDKLLSLREMAGCIASAQMHLGTCSAPRHMAVAVGTPSFIVLGSTSPAWTNPDPAHAHFSRGLECQPCNKNVCLDHEDPPCLTDLPAKSVLPYFLEHLHKTNPLPA